MSPLALLGMFLLAAGLLLVIGAVAWEKESLVVGSVSILLLGIVSIFIGSAMHERNKN